MFLGYFHRILLFVIAQLAVFLHIENVKNLVSGYQRMLHDGLRLFNSGFGDSRTLQFFEPVSNQLFEGCPSHLVENAMRAVLADPLLIKLNRGR